MFVKQEKRTYNVANGEGVYDHHQTDRRAVRRLARHSGSRHQRTRQRQGGKTRADPQDHGGVRLPSKSCGTRARLTETMPRRGHRHRGERNTILLPHHHCPAQSRRLLRPFRARNAVSPPHRVQCPGTMRCDCRSACGGRGGADHQPHQRLGGHLRARGGHRGRHLRRLAQQRL